jgi:tetratricopeptide (TPR) repeat protein
MGHLMRTLTTCVMVLAALPLGGWGDVVQLDDGRKIEGVILSESPLEVSLKLDSGALVRLRRDRIRSITKADADYYIKKGDTAPTAAEALELYQAARKLNPTAPGLDERINATTSRAALEAKRLVSRQEQERHLAEETRIMRRYQQFMDAVQSDAARDFLEKAIAEEPWLCQPRIKLAEEFYARQKSADGRVRYVIALAGLVQNRPSAYYATYAPQIVEAAERALLDTTARPPLAADVKDRVISLASQFLGDEGRILPLDQYESRQAETPTSSAAVLARIEFLKSACVKRPTDDPGIEPVVTILLNTARSLARGGEAAALRGRLDRWAKQAQGLLDSGDPTKGAALAEIVLAIDSQNSRARRVAVASRVQEARRFRRQTLFDKARASLEAAERMVPRDSELAAEKAQLFVGLAMSHRAAGRFEEAISDITAAVAARSTDTQVGQAIGAEQNSLYDTLLQRASDFAGQQNFGSAIEAAELARKAKPGFMTGLRLDPVIRGYRGQLGASVLKRIASAAGRDAYGEVAVALMEAQKYGAADGLTSPIKAVIAMGSGKARMLADKGQMLGAWIVASRLLMLQPDARTASLAKKAHADVVLGGKLTLQNFFAGRWRGQDVQLDTSETAVTFIARDWRVNATGLAANSVRADHGNAEQYTIRVDRPEAKDALVVRVMGPDALMLESYSSEANAPAQPTAPATFNAPLVRVSPLPVPMPTQAPPATPGAPPAPGAPPPSGQSPADS